MTSFKIKLALTALALLPSLAHAHETCRLPAGVQVVTGLRPDKPQHVSNKKPEMAPLKGAATSWGVQTTLEINRANRVAPAAGRRVDPYKLVIEGANKGTVLTVTKKGALQAIAMPTVERLALRDSRGRRLDSAKLRKIVNADYNHQIEKAVATARPDEALATATQGGPSSAQAVVIESASPLPTNSTLTVSGKDPFGRAYPARELLVDGRPYEDHGWSGWSYIDNNRATQREHTELGGRFQPSESAQIVRQNLFSTPVLERTTRLGGYEKKDGHWVPRVSRQTYAKVLGLAAFSPRSTVTITNLRMEALGGEQQAHASVTLTSNRKGAGAIEVPAEMGDELRIAVQTRRGPEIQGSTTSTVIKVPLANQSSKFVHDRFLAVD